MAVIVEFGTAPEQAKKGYKGLGIYVKGTDREVLKVFGGGADIVLVRGASFYGVDEHEFYPMLRE
jgi:hypothetical protein